MNEFVLSTFLKIIQEGLVEHSGQEECAKFIFEPIVNQDIIEVTTDLSTKKVSYIINRERPVPEDFKNASLNSTVANNVRKYFEEEVIEDLNSYTELDTYEKVLNTIKSDNSISTKIKDNFQKLFDSEEYAKFLAEAFLYSLQKDNVLKKTTLNKNDLPLLSEVNYKCPISHTNLLENKKGVTISKYVIVQIFPDDLSEEDNILFSNISDKPIDFDDNSNLIALSINAAQEYINNPNVDDFKILLSIKKRAVSNAKALEYVNEVKLEEDLRKIVKSLDSLSSTEGLDLKYDALSVNQKIKKFDVREDVKNKVIRYYNYINSLFDESEMNFNLIASEVKLVSTKLESADFSQEDIIDKLSDWIHHQVFNDSDEGKLACNIIVCFFIQNCEVFSYEMAK